MGFKTNILHALADLIQSKYPQLIISKSSHSIIDISKEFKNQSDINSVDQSEQTVKIYIASINVFDDYMSISYFGHCSFNSLDNISIYDPNSIQIIEDSLDKFVHKYIKDFDMSQIYDIFYNPIGKIHQQYFDYITIK